jgi:hypothetical protein
MEGEAGSEETAMTVWVYIDTSKQPGDVDHVVVFADQDVASAWFAKNDPEGVAFEYRVIGK